MLHFKFSRLDADGGAQLKTVKEYFPENYFEACDNILKAVTLADWKIESVSPIGQPRLRTHYLQIGSEEPRRLLVLTSGLHGVEGFLGSAIQLALIQEWSQKLQSLQKDAVLLVHAINPFGFEQIRRVDETNVDLNRNFLFGKESWHGAHETYRSLDRFLNPTQWPIRELPFRVQAIWKIAKHGFQPLQQAIAEGQYDFPHGLFFGGHQSSKTANSLRNNLLPRLQSAKEILHLDIHSGLGRSGALQLLLDHELSQENQERLNSIVADQFRLPDSKTGYRARGSINQWIHHHVPQACSFCLEFGTYPAIEVLAALRGENAAYHWSDPQSKSFQTAKNRVLEVFCPKSTRWRITVMRQANELIERVINKWLLDE